MDSIIFRLIDNNPQVRLIHRASVGLGALSLVTLLVSYLTGLTGAPLTAGIAMMCGGVLVAMWRLSGQTTGTLELRPEGMFVSTRRRSFAIPWNDVNEVELAHTITGLNGMTFRILGIRSMVRLIVKLRVGLKEPWWGSRSGTRVSGLPTPTKSLDLYVEHPEECLTLVTKRLHNYQPRGMR
jgi:hypothetical protein